MVASVSTHSKIMVEKSTVPVKTAEAIEKVGNNCSCSGRCTPVFGNPHVHACSSCNMLR